MSSCVIILLAASPKIPAACIFPATNTSSFPTAAEICCNEAQIAELEIPLPGLPVKTNICTPNAKAFCALATLAKRPLVMPHN